MSRPEQKPAGNSEARKRAEGDHYAHHDPAVRDLIEKAYMRGLDQGWSDCLLAYQKLRQQSSREEYPR